MADNELIEKEKNLSFELSAELMQTCREFLASKKAQNLFEEIGENCNGEVMRLGAMSFLNALIMYLRICNEAVVALGARIDFRGLKKEVLDKAFDNFINEIEKENNARIKYNH